MNRFAQLVAGAAVVIALGAPAHAVEIDMADFEPASALSGTDVIRSLSDRLEAQDSVEQAASELEPVELLSADDALLESPLAAR